MVRSAAQQAVDGRPHAVFRAHRRAHAPRRVLQRRL
jgi:hypothetical protein